jgi:DNA-binding MarR family transcriptional regulator
VDSNIRHVAETALDRLPTRNELLAYRSFLRAHARVTRCLEGDLIAEQRLTLAAYDVLEALTEAPEQRLRMTELADVVLLSRSGVTRLVDRLERLGLVRRVRVDSDGRGVQAVITERGEGRLRMAASTHRHGVARYFLNAADGELETLVRACERLADGGVPSPPGQRAQA